MKRMKLTTTLVCALTVLAFSATALAHDDYLDEDHIDDPENGKYVFWDEEDMYVWPPSDIVYWGEQPSPGYGSGWTYDVDGQDISRWAWSSVVSYVRGYTSCP